MRGSRARVDPSDDPIAALVRDLLERGAPSLEWAVRWSHAGTEPVRAAWAVSAEPKAMVFLLGALEREPEALGTMLAQFGVPRLSRMPGRLAFVIEPDVYAAHLAAAGSPEAFNAMLARAIRRVVPEPPTLASLLERFAPRD